MIRILVGDDHPIIRRGLKQILNEKSDMIVKDEASNGYEVLDKIQKNDFDIVLLDISMPGMNGIDVLKQIKLIKPGLPVLILSMLPEEQYAIRVLKAGASGYLTKESAPEELIMAIRKVSNKGKYISNALGEKLALDLTFNSNKMVYEFLSDREFQVMCMIASGKTVSAIADELSLSVKTISTYRSRILTKMNMRNNAELTHYAFENNLIPKIIFEKEKIH